MRQSQRPELIEIMRSTMDDETKAEWDRVAADFNAGQHYVLALMGTYLKTWNAVRLHPSEANERRMLNARFRLRTTRCRCDFCAAHPV